jgi:hypothetical protein
VAVVPITFGATVAGVDANSGGALAATATPGVTVTAQTPAELTATVGAGPTVASVGQPVAVTFTLVNGGSGAAGITAVTPLSSGASATCGAPAPALPQVIAAGGRLDFAWTCTPTSAGSLSISGAAAGTDVVSGAPLSAAPAAPVSVTVQPPPALSATAFTATRTTASVGQAIGVTLTLANGGGATANLSAVAPTVTPPSIATCTAASPGPPQAVPGGGSVTFTWSCTGTVAGGATLGVAISATDANTGSAIGAPAPSIAVTVQTPAALSATVFSVAPSTATVGQAIGVTLTLSNGGGADAEVSGVAPSVSPPSAVCGAPSPATPATIAGGATRTFTWTCTPSSAGTVTLGATVVAADANTGAALPAPVAGLPVSVVTAAALTAAVTVDRATADVGQVLSVTLTVGNTGAAGATVTTVTPTATGGATATCGTPTPAPPLPVAGGGGAAFTWTCTPTSSGTLSLGASVAGIDAVSGAALSAAGSATVVVQRPATLAVTAFLAGRSAASLGQAVPVTLTVANGGDVTALVGAVASSAAGVAATCSDPSPAPPVAIGGGQSVSFGWTCTPSEAGGLVLGASVSGTDAISGAAIGATAVPASVTVQVPASLAVSAFTASPTPAYAGQRIDVALTVANAGGAAAAVSAVTPAVVPSSSGTCTAPVPAPPQVVAGGASLSFTWSCTLGVVGDATLGATVVATDANSGAAAGATATGIPVTVLAPATLVATSFSAAPTTAPAGQPIAVTLVLSNTGGATATVTTVTPSASPAGNIACTAVTPAPPQPIAGGASLAFGWSCTATQARTYSLRASVIGTDASTGATLTPTINGISVTWVKAAAGGGGVAASALAGPSSGEVVLVAADPLGDGTPAAPVAAFRGAVLVGSGRALVRLDPAGGAPERVDLALGVDAGPTPAANAAWLASAPATSLGSPGCLAGTRACGPDDEAGLALLAGGWMAGEERLLLAGAAERGRYLHLAVSSASPIASTWVDLDAALPRDGLAALGAALFAPGAPDRLYLGLARAGAGPVLLALATPPVAAGLDALPGVDLLDLGLPAAAGAGLPTLADFGGVLYATAGGGLLRSAAPAPGGRWEEATPDHAAWADRSPVEAPGAAGWPRDRAVPALVGFGACGSGPCLFAARNVAGSADRPAIVAQLWRCAPTAGPAGCAPGDWTLVAPDADDPFLTRLGGPTSGAVSILAATPRWLYVGFDDEATGVQLFRAARAPSSASDFEGLGGCAAGTAGCEGLGGAGLGVAGVTRVFGAVPVTVDGVGSLWIAAGDGVGPVSVFRVDD